MKRLWCAAIALVACVCAAPVLAQSGATRPVIVAGDAALGLYVYDEDDDVCVTLAGDDGGDQGCIDEEPGRALVDVDEDAAYVGVALTTPAAARVEVRRGGRLLGGAATTDGAAYRGREAGRLRFALVRIAPRTPADGLRVHAYDAAGALVAVVAQATDDALVTSRTTLLSGRAGRLGWRLVARRESRLAPSILDLAHERMSTCVQAVTSPVATITNSTTCISDEPRDIVFTAFDEAAEEVTCGSPSRLVHGIVGGTVRRVRVVLGDGRRVTARLAAVAGTSHRAYAAATGNAAVRRIELLTASGATRALAIDGPPAGVACNGRERGWFISSIPIAADTPVATVGPATQLPGPPPLRIADGAGGTLCLALARRPFTAFGCDIVSPYLDDLFGVADDLLRPTAMAFAVPARVVAARVAGPGGTRTIPAVRAFGYAGPYAGAVRFVAATGPDLATSRIELLDAAGTVLRTLPAPPELPRWQTFQPRRIAGRAGAPSLWQTTTRYGSGVRVRCVTLTAGLPPRGDDACVTHRGAQPVVLLAASCATRRLTVAVATTPGARVHVDTGNGRVVPIRLRAGAGILTLAPRRPLRAITIVRGAKLRRIAIDAPPAAEQCGWRTDIPYAG